MKFRPILLTAAAAIVFTACSSGAATTAPATPAPATQAPSDSPMASMAPSMAPSSATGGEVMTDTAAADLRVALNNKLGAHLIFASKATGAALGGRNDEFAAYGTLLNTNGTDLGEMIGSVYGAEAKDAFNKIWSAHNASSSTTRPVSRPRTWPCRTRRSRT